MPLLEDQRSKLPVQGVPYWPLPEDIWQYYVDRDLCAWMNDRKRFDPSLFDAQCGYWVANEWGIDGLGPCLRNKWNEYSYILKDRTGNYYLYDEEFNLLFAFRKDGWTEEEILETIAQGLIRNEALVNYQTYVTWQPANKLTGLAEHDEDSSTKDATKSIPTTPRLSAIQALNEATLRPKSPLKRLESPVEISSPAKRFTEQSIETVARSEASSYGNCRERGGSDDTDLTDLTDVTLIADMGAALDNASNLEDKDSKKSNDEEKKDASPRFELDR